MESRCGSMEGGDAGEQQWPNPDGAMMCEVRGVLGEGNTKCVGTASSIITLGPAFNYNSITSNS